MSIFFMGLLLALWGCQLGSPKGQKQVRVVVSIPPYISLVKAIVGDTMEVTSALGGGFDPHTVEITPRQMKLVQDANLFIGIGQSYEAKLLSTIRGKVHILELNYMVPLISASKNTRVVDPCQDVEFPKEHGEDLHIWLGPKRLPLQVKEIAKMLIALKPENHLLYEKNRDRLIAKIEALTKKLETELHPFQKRAIMVSHSSLGYFCHDFNLVQVAVECEGKSPLPHHVNRVLDFAKHEDVICVFTAPQFDNKGALLIAKELDLRVAEFDPLAEDLLGTIEMIGKDIVK